MALSAGTRLGPYEILAPLGAGGMGEVYRARDTRLLREVAIKVVPPSLADRPGALERFEREAQAVAALSHPHIVVIHDVGHEGSTSYLVMELLEGETLRARLKRGPLPESAAIDLARKVATALAATHSKGVIHRDLKPENLFLTSDTIKILDFGLSMASIPQATVDTSSSPTATRGTLPGAVLGTMGYMSPEQLLGRGADARSDIFAFGAVLFEILTARPAFAGESTLERASAILRDRPDLSHSGAGPALTAIVYRCLEKDASGRFQTAQDLVKALQDLPSAEVASGLPRRLPESETASASAPSRPGEPSLPRRALLVASLAAALVLAFALWWWRAALSGSAQPAISALAILPLANLTGDPAQDYLVDGIHDALVATLSNIPALRVTSRTSVRSTQLKGLTIPEIASKLGVDAVVEGSVLRQGPLVRITTELIAASPERPLWSASFDGETDHVFALQGEVARAITEQVRGQLTPVEVSRLAGPKPVPPEAEEAYLRGRHLWRAQTESSVREAVDYFEEALRHQPNFPLAYSGLADSFIALSWVGPEPIPAAEAYPRAKAAASRALELDPTAAEAWVSLGIVHWRYDWDWPAAEQAFRRALGLNGSSAEAHHWYALFLATMGRHDEARGEMEIARRLDPLSLLISINTAWTAYFAGRYDDARREIESAIRFWPGVSVPYYHRALLHERLGKLDLAIADLERAVELGGPLPYLLGTLGYMQGRAGDQTGARGTLGRIQRLRSSPASAAALVHVGLGEHARALAQLDRALAERDAYLVFLKTNPLWDSLREEPGFQDLLRRVGFR